MTDYFKIEYLEDAKSHKKRLTLVLIASIFVFIGVSTVFIVLFLREPYQSSKIGLIKWLHYLFIGIFVVYMSIFLGIPYKRVRKFCKLCLSFGNGMVRSYSGEYQGAELDVSVREGVDTYYLEFKEYNKDKGAYFIRKISVLAEKELPPFEKGDKVNYFTHNNFLIKYEIIEKSNTTTKE